MKKEEFIEIQKNQKISFINLLKILNSSELFLITLLLLLSFFSIFIEFLSISSIPLIFSYLLDFSPQIKILDNIFLILEKYSLNNLNFIVYFVISIFFLRSLFLYVIKILDFVVYKRIRLRISSNLIEKYLNSKVEEMQKDTAATKIWKLEIVNIFTSVIDSIINLVRNTSYALAILIFLALFSTIDIILFFIPIILLVLLFYFISTEYIKRTGKLSDLGRNKKINSIQNIINGIKDIFILKKKEFFLNEFKDANKQFEKFIQKNIIITNIPVYFIEFVGVLVICLFFIKFNSLSQSPENTVSALTVLAYGGIRLIAISKINLVHFNNYKRYAFILATIKNEIEKKISPINLDKIIYNENEIKENLIEIKNLNFGYNNQLLFKDVNLVFEKNKMYALFGKSGSGKSTFLDFLLGIKNPIDGQITINCNKNKLGYVPQECYLSDGTIKTNLAFGIEETKIDQNKLLSSAKEAEILDFINSSRLGFETPISIFGSNISVGQKQRIGIARALYHDPKILLLDEPTSSLDIETEKNFLKTLQKIKKNRLIIMTTHKTNIKEYIDCSLDLKNKSIYLRDNS